MDVDLDKYFFTHHSIVMNNKENIIAALGEVTNKYKAAGWNVVVPPQNAINDVIAQKGKKMHFAQVIIGPRSDDAKHSNLAKNTFIQNAFSNAAIPIYAYVSFHKHKSTAMPYSTITFEDVNLNTRVIVTKSNIKN